jgi:hypothetical protein
VKSHFLETARSHEKELVNGSISPTKLEQVYKHCEREREPSWTTVRVLGSYLFFMLKSPASA